MGFQLPGPTKGKVQYLVETYQAEVLDRDHSDFRKRTWILMDKRKDNQLPGVGKLKGH
jgi:hypothetical protein